MLFLLRYLEKAQLLEARERAAAEDDMVDKGDAEHLARPCETIRQGLVFFRRMRVATWVIVESHHRPVTKRKCGLKNVSRRHRNTVTTAGRDDLLAEQAVFRVEGEDAEHLAGVCGVPGQQVGGHGFG